jgi:nitrite reductase/ring-hydroxylating ferredoxin subunit/uncharacterized membrane protein
MASAVIDSATARRQLTPFEPLVRAIESASVLDRPAKAVAKQIRSTLSGPVKDTVSGVWLGHALHPALTDLVIGSFTSASLLDLFIGEDGAEASERLIALGIAAYAPTAVSGANDWADTEPVDDAVRRAGIIHAGSNAVALGLYTASLIARRRGARGRGIAYSSAGAAILMFGGYLGGHLSMTKGVGPNETAFDPGPTEWTPAADAAQLPDRQPTRVVVDETPVLLLRDGDRIFAIHDRCSHRGCSLSGGEVEGEQIVCACHGSRFDLKDGSVKGGPATSPQPAFQVRHREGVLEVRRLSPGSV